MISSTAAVETQFAEQFREIIKGKDNDALVRLRSEAYDYFKSVGFPSTRDEDWKYTNVSAIEKAGFDVYNENEVDDGGISNETLHFAYRRNGLTALNLAFGDIQPILIPVGQKIEEPIYLGTYAVDGAMQCPHYTYVAGAGSESTIIEIYEAGAPAFINTAIQVVVGDNARVTHYRVQKQSSDSFHYGVTEVTLGRDSYYDSTNINLGAALSRHDIDVKFTAEGGEAWVDGLYMLNGSQHHDTHSIIDHTVPNCTSHQTYKGVLNDKSRGVFNGKVFVRENAHGTDAQQSNKNLLLSNDARVDTKPQLEIFNDDVKCSHGATVGQLEEEELFYLLTRGLPPTLAKNLLTYGFAEEVINKIGIEAIKRDLDATVLNRLGTNI